ncbi:protein PLASTID MOVEMENT IMPAIRED 1-like [Phoenix dactylifera]|uniref:Protein PLASTID MOVEMENT IMPAIRED 1-like n=1 Tax=Phoenix dactylifera TaxID=42345 RepID=A0A8B8J335_PHODC|nr:protein PLASTID MOVEMENT IMPAIRED 1-like [Phoenix dactylifera]
MAGRSERGDSSSQLLQELETLSQSLHQSQASRRRRTTSLVLPRSAYSATAPVDGPGITEGIARSDRYSRSSRYASLSPWRSRPKPQTEAGGAIDADDQHHHPPSKFEHKSRPGDGGRKGIWNWKPLRALSHIGMQRLACLFSVEVIAVHGLPASLNGLRLSISVRKKEAKDGAVQTMPSPVLQGSADFDETLFVKCHLYCSGGVGTGKPLKFEPRPFLISMLAIDAPELDFGRNMVDLSLMVLDSIEKSLEGVRVRQWDTSFKLSGKAKGGKLALRLGFQMMEDGGVGIYSQAEAVRSNKGKDSSYSVARKQTRSSFSVISPRATRSAKDLKGLNETRPPTSIHKSEPESTMQDLDLPEFEVIDMGIQIQGERAERDEVKSKDAAEATSASSEVVKEVMHDRDRQVSLTELDSISRQIKAIESMMTGDGINPLNMARGHETQQLDHGEETVTREFLQMLELEDDDDDDDEHKYIKPEHVASLKSEAAQGTGDEAKVLLSDLGKSLGPVVQTKDGGYLVSTNPFNVAVERKEIPKLVMQVSRPHILQYQKLGSGFEVFQRLASMDLEDLSCKLFSLTAMDELRGKSAEQIAFEGIASAIISGRNKEGASSSAAKLIAAVKKMATAMSEGRKERMSTGIWFVKEDPVTMEEILAFSLQKMEAMSVEALKVQADMAEEEAPFEFSPHLGKDDPNHDNLLDSAISPENWEKDCSSDTTMTMLAIIQLRNPLRSLEAVGAPMMVVVQAERVEKEGEDEGCRFKVTSLHLGALKLRSGGMRSVWDGEKQKLTAKQWLVAYGLGNAGRKTKTVPTKRTQDLLWSLSSRVMADMWLKPMRNPDVKIKTNGK